MSHIYKNASLINQSYKINPQKSHPINSMANISSKIINPYILLPIIYKTPFLNISHEPYIKERVRKMGAAKAALNVLRPYPGAFCIELGVQINAGICHNPSPSLPNPPNPAMTPAKIQP